MRCRCGAVPVVKRARLDRAVARAALEGRSTVTLGLDL